MYSRSEEEGRKEERKRRGGMSEMSEMTAGVHGEVSPSTKRNLGTIIILKNGLQRIFHTSLHTFPVFFFFFWNFLYLRSPNTSLRVTQHTRLTGTNPRGE